jgi:hypothetical protein
LFAPPCNPGLERGNPDNGIGRCHKGEKSGNNADDYDFHHRPFHQLIIIHERDTGGNEEERHVPEQEVAFFLYVLCFNDFTAQEQKEKNHSCYARGKMERQNTADSFTDKTDAEDDTYLENNFHRTTS